MSLDIEMFLIHGPFYFITHLEYYDLTKKIAYCLPIFAVRYQWSGTNTKT